MEYAIQGCSNVVIKKCKDQSPVLFLPQAFLTNIHTEGEYDVSKGGEQGLSLIGWNSQNEGSFVIKTPTISMQILEMTAKAHRQTLTKLVNANEEVQGDGSNTLKLSRPPANPNIQVYRLSPSTKTILSSLAVIDIDDDIITLEENESNWALVLYQYSAIVDQLDIGKFMNSGYYTIQGMTDIYNEITGVQEKMYFEIPKADIVPSFNMSLLNNANPDHLTHIQCVALKQEDTLVNVFMIEGYPEPEEPDEPEEPTEPEPEYYIAYNEGNNSEYWYVDTTGAYADGGIEENHMWAENGASLKYRMDLEDNGIPPFIDHTKYLYVTVDYEIVGDEGTGVTFAVVEGLLEYTGGQEEILGMYSVPTTERTTMTIELLPEGTQEPTQEGVTIGLYVHSNRTATIHNIVLHTHEDHLPAFLT